MNQNEVKTFLKEHRREIIIGVGITAAVVIGGVVVYRYVGSASKQAVEASSKATSILDKGKVPSPAIKAEEAVRSTMPIDKLPSQGAANRLTATKLGDKVWKSPQEINKRLEKAGLLARTPGGEPYPTEAGKQFCNVVGKTRPWGYTAYVPEWDESVLTQIFSGKELADIAEKQRLAAEVVKNIA